MHNLLFAKTTIDGWLRYRLHCGLMMEPLNFVGTYLLTPFGRILANFVFSGLVTLAVIIAVRAAVSMIPHRQGHEYDMLGRMMYKCQI